jgi:hypothetical protein
VPSFRNIGEKIGRTTEKKLHKGQTQCQRLPHEWGLGKGITEAKSYPRRNSAERKATCTIKLKEESSQGNIILL